MIKIVLLVIPIVLLFVTPSAYSKVDRQSVEKCWAKVQPNKEIRDLASPQAKTFLENMFISNNITEIYKEPIWIDILGCLNGVPYEVHPFP